VGCSYFAGKVLREPLMRIGYSSNAFFIKSINAFWGLVATIKNLSFMKRFTLFFGLLIIVTIAFAQAPQAFNYQAVSKKRYIDFNENHAGIKTDFLSVQTNNSFGIILGV
jgi:hypothetical protein